MKLEVVFNLNNSRWANPSCKGMLEEVFSKQCQLLIVKQFLAKINVTSKRLASLMGLTYLDKVVH